MPHFIVKTERLIRFITGKTFVEGDTLTDHDIQRLLAGRDLTEPEMLALRHEHIEAILDRHRKLTPAADPHFSADPEQFEPWRNRVIAEARVLTIAPLAPVSFKTARTLPVNPPPDPAA